jgi:hypothetical protein
MVLRALPEQDQWCLFLRAEGLRYREIAGAPEPRERAVDQQLGIDMTFRKQNEKDRVHMVK